MGFELREALRRICVEIGWSYAVFWRAIGSPTPKHLVWEDGHWHGKQQISRQDDPNSHANFSTGFRTRGESIIDKLVNKTMVSEVHAMGYGMVGQAASLGNHQWILCDAANDREPILSPKCSRPKEDLAQRRRKRLRLINERGTVSQDRQARPAEALSPKPSFYLQEFSPTPGENVRAMPWAEGSRHSNGERSLCKPCKNFFYAILMSARIFCGVPPKSLGQRNLQHASISSTTSDYPSRDSCSNTDKSLSNRCNHQLFISSTSRLLNQSSSSLSTQCHGNMFKIDPERLSTKKIATSASLPVTGSHQPLVHLTGNSSFNLNHRLETGLMEAKVISHRDMMPSVNEISLATGSLSFMEENLLSICGSRIQEPGNGIKASVEGMFREYDSDCLHPKFAVLESANDHGRFISAANCTKENIKSSSPIASGANPQSISQDINVSNGKQGISRSSQENSSPMSSSVHLKQNISSDLPSSSGYGFVQGSTVGGNLVIEGANCYSSHFLNAKKGKCRGVEIDTIFTQSPNEKSSTYHLPLPTFGDDLFEAFGLYGSLDRELPFDSHSSLDVGSCNTQPNLPPIFYSVIDNNLSTTEIFSESNTDQLLEAVISKVNQGTRHSLDESTSCKTSATKVGGSSSNDKSTSSGKKHEEYISPSRVTSNSEAAASTSMRSADSIDQTERSGCCKSQISLWVENSRKTKSDELLVSNIKRFDETSKVNRKRPRPGETPRPRPKDRQLIMDRIKELREIVPNGAKCSIDALMEKTIKHMIFLQSVAKHADKLRDSSEPKV
ncbi:Transcription factor LHW [Platanthera guangdongensis]|uniref:Transcription factor LHW n=1 Tax=Platanthera guangdongensis TaxID=2320717 RepID=A0ABR2MV92_9ASPA